MMLSLSACSVLQAVAPPAHPGALPPQPQPFFAAPQASTTPPSPDEAQAEIVQWFHDHGYNDFQIQALVQHARTESGFRPCAVGPGGYHYLYQWSSTRLEQLQEFAQTSGCPQLHTQLAFADKELRHDPKFACFWSATSEPAAYTALRRGFGGGSC
ncbi:MAG TPA: phage tail tip lysozyme [Stellaceae bacterium]|jgi:hypothetical protein|nr:phage tail tip lysozyme [Stellaceae bacterium]